MSVVLTNLHWTGRNSPSAEHCGGLFSPNPCRMRRSRISQFPGPNEKRGNVYLCVNFPQTAEWSPSCLKGGYIEQGHWGHRLVFMKSGELDSIILLVPIHTKPFKPTNPIILLNITYTVLAFLFVWCHKSPFPLDQHTSTAPAPCHTAPHRKPLNPGTEGCRRCCCCWCIGSPRFSAFAAGKRTSLEYQREALLDKGSCWALNNFLRQHLRVLRITSSKSATQVAWRHWWT